MPTSATTLPRISDRLRSDVALIDRDGQRMLRVGDVLHEIHLAPDEVDAVASALVDGREPAGSRPKAALAALRAAGLIDVPVPAVAIEGEGVLAVALRGALARIGALPDADGMRIVVSDDDSSLGGLPIGVRACWRTGHRVFLSPVDVPARDVQARHRAATLASPADAPGPGEVHSSRDPLSGVAVEVAAAHLAAALLHHAPISHEVVVVDLVALQVSRHPVLPVPPAPR